VSKSRLHELSERGQSVWFDTLSRPLIETGELKRMIEEDAVVGVTSNPTIFQKALAEGEAERGVLVCGSGVGAAVAACKVFGIRASVCHDSYSAHQGVEHDDMNVLCLGSEIVGPALARELVAAFVGARFNTEEPRYAERLEKVAKMERGMKHEQVPST